MDAEDATCATELVVDGAKVYLFDAELAKQRRAHDAGLHGNVQNALADDLGVDTLETDEALAVRIQVALATVLVALVGWAAGRRRRGGSLFVFGAVLLDRRDVCIVGILFSIVLGVAIADFDRLLRFNIEFGLGLCLGL